MGNEALVNLRADTSIIQLGSCSSDFRKAEQDATNSLSGIEDL
jgi:hypothetical protein